MIEVTISHDGDEIGRLRFEKTFSDSDGSADYRVEIGVERLGSVGAVGLYPRMVKGHRPLEDNVLYLVRRALFTLKQEELSLEPDTRPSDLARRFNRVVPAIQAWASGLRHHRSTLRSGQSEQYGDDSRRQGLRPED